MTEQPTQLPQLDISSLPGPDSITRALLDNGITVLTRANFASPSVVISGYLPAGGLLDDEATSGRASLTASAIMRGTTSHDFQQIYESIESIGASLRVGAGTHYASFRGKALVEDLETLLGLLAEVMREPSFPKDPVEQLRGERLTALARRDQDTRAVAGLTFDDLAYPEHPYRIASEGQPETISGLSLDDLRQFHAAHYRPNQMVVAVVGAVESGRALSAVEAALGSWSGSGDSVAVDAPPMAAPSETRRRDVALAGKTQADLVVGAPGPARSHPGYLAAALGNNVLGRFGLMGRVGDSVREQAGLAYYAYSSLSGGQGPGPWQVIAGVNPANIEQAIDLITSEIERFAGEVVTEEELADVQANSIGSLPLQLQSNEGVAGALVHIERHQLGLDYYQKFPERVAAITREQILEVAAAHLDPSRLIIATAGPPQVS